MRMLSSPVTFLCKYIFPLGYVFIYLYSSWYLMADKSTHLDHESIGFLVICLLLTGYGFFLSLQLKRVRIDEKNVYISNYRREIVVPAENIKNATEKGWMIPHTILIEFERETEFGNRIRFIPAFFKDWEAMADLRKLIRGN